MIESSMNINDDVLQKELKDVGREDEEYCGYHPAGAKCHHTKRNRE